MIEMISRRLTKNQKAEILNSFREGDSSNSLAKKYSCTANTIIRTVKTLLSDGEYNLLKVNKKRRLMSSIISCIVSCRRFSKATIPLCNNDELCFLATILDMLSSFFRNALKRFI